MNKRIKIFTITSGLLLLILALIESNAFKKREKILWEHTTSLSWDNFRGYPNFLSHYAAAINSYFELKNLNDTTKAIQVETVMRAHRSWVKNQYDDSDYLLRHEQYHFNISELIARRLRKSISNTPEQGLTKENIEKLYYQHMSELGYSQDFYDLETDHSLKLEPQYDWEYIVDSMLIDLGIYANNFTGSEIHKKGQKYYRKIDKNAWHQFEGLYPIDSALAMRTKHYRVFYRNNKISRIEYWNRNKPSLDKDRKVFAIEVEVKQGFETYTYFNINKEKSSNSNSNYGQIIEHKNNKLIVSNLNKEGVISNNKNGIGKIVWSLDHKKRKEVGHIYDESGNRITDNEGYYTVKYKYDKFNNLTEYANYNCKNKRKPSNDGISFYKYLYDANQNIISIQGYNEKAMLCAFDKNIAIVNRCYDVNGNVTMQCFKNNRGKVIVTKVGVAVNFNSYDECANILTEAYYGLNKNLKISDKKIGLLVRQFDSIGRVIEVNNFDAYKEPLNDIIGSCKVLYTYDSIGLLCEEKKYYVDSMLDIKHFKTIQSVYDSRKNQISETWLNEHNEYQPDSNNICIAKFEYDEMNNLLKYYFYNDSMQLQNNNQGIATFEYKYDKRNNRTDVAYFDQNLKPTVINNNVVLEKYSYNEQNFNSEVKYYNEQGKLTPGDLGVEIIRWKYNLQGYIIEESYFNSNGKRCGDNRGAAKFSYKYDEKGNIIQTNIYATNNKLVRNNNSGIAIIANSYNEQNKLIKTAYFDYKKQLINLPEGYAYQVYKYNGFGYMSRQEYYSEFEQPTVSSSGFAAIDNIYDLNFNIIAQTLRDENNDLIADASGNTFYNWEYDRNGNVINSTSFSDQVFNIRNISFGDFGTKIIGIRTSNTLTIETDNTRLQTTYFKNGQKRSEVMYVDGKLEGKYITYYETGELEGEINYVNGKRQGLMIDYSKSGQKISELKYENNIYVLGSEKEWYLDGSIRSEFIKGEPVKYDPEGNRIID